MLRLAKLVSSRKQGVQVGCNAGGLQVIANKEQIWVAAQLAHGHDACQCTAVIAAASGCQQGCHHVGAYQLFVHCHLCQGSKHFNEAISSTCRIAIILPNIYLNCISTAT